MMIMALPLNVATRHEIMIVQATVIVKGNDHQVMEMIIMAAGIRTLLLFREVFYMCNL